MEAIPILVAEGDHRSVGRAIGAASAAALAADLAITTDLDGHRARVEPYLRAAELHLPRVVEELRGCAEGSGIDLVDIAILGTEELFTVQPKPAGMGCTDVAATGPATAGGETILAHTNDLAPVTLDRLLAIDRRIHGEPRIFGIGVGPYLSAGMNDAGVALGGNQLDANDERIGVPRLMLVRELLAQRSAAAAIGVALHPDRASAYNNIVGSADGTLVSVEGSATAHGLIDAAERGGTLTHANHYAVPSMAGFELDPEEAIGSCARQARAEELLEQARRPLTEDAMLAILADRSDPEHPIARTGTTGSRTVFWCVMNPSRKRMRFARGAPGEAGGGPEQSVQL